MGLWLQISLYKRPNIFKGAMNVCTSFEIAMFQQKPGQNENRRIAVHDFPFVCISFIIHIMVWQKYGPINRGQSNCARKYVFDVFTMIDWRLYLYISACNICVLWGAYCPNTHFVTYYIWLSVCVWCVRVRVPLYDCYMLSLRVPSLWMHWFTKFTQRKISEANRDIGPGL